MNLTELKNIFRHEWNENHKSDLWCPDNLTFPDQDDNNHILRVYTFNVCISLLIKFLVSEAKLALG